jgi:hypothetical protein
LIAFSYFSENLSYLDHQYDPNIYILEAIMLSNDSEFMWVCSMASELEYMYEVTT